MMTFGVNLLREHVKPTVRMHYVVKQGGRVPNIVPDHAKLWLWVRDSTRKGVKQVVERIEQVAEGAALATGTIARVNNLGSYHEMLVNLSGSKAMQKNLEMIGPIDYTKEELAFAKSIQKEVEVDEIGMAGKIQELEKPAKDPEGGSTDVAEVSWITPTIHISVSCAPYEVPWHSWAVVSSSKHPIGYKGMLLAAKVMAATGLDFMLDDELLSEMIREFKEKLKGYTYKSGIPSDKKPPIRTK
jgi:aminobenzoyl-glutamate utilization protein B